MLERRLEPEVMDTHEEATEYDTMDHSEPNGAFVQRLVELGARGQLLDLGTGPGHIPLLICEWIAGIRVLGVDLSVEMLKIAEARRQRSPYRDRIAYRLGDVKKLPFEASTFDAVVSNTILHHLADPRPYLSEAWRVLRPGGVLLIRDLYRPADEDVLAELVRKHAGDCTPKQQQMFGDSLRAALRPEELEALAQELGIEAEIIIDTDRHMSLQRTAEGYTHRP